MRPWVLALASLAAAGEPLDEEMAAKDTAIAKRIAAALPSGETKIEDFVRKLAPDDTDEDREIGFGARRLRLALFGGYTTARVTVIAWNGRVGPVEIRYDDVDPEDWSQLRDRIAPAYKGRDPAVSDTSLRVGVGHRADPAGFREARAKTLGPPLGIDPDPSLEKAYVLLWSPFSDLVYGTMYGEDGGPPPGREALETLVAHDRGEALLDDVLRGPNPEGRLYAAEGLLRLERKGKKLGEDVRKNIEWVRKSDVGIQVCRGCEVSCERAAAPLAETLEELR